MRLLQRVTTAPRRTATPLLLLLVLASCGSTSVAGNPKKTGSPLRDAGGMTPGDLDASSDSGATADGGKPDADAGVDAGCTQGPCLPLGSTCTKPSACASGFCVDGVCCASACGGGAKDDCQACTSALTGGNDGTCTLLESGTVCRASAGGCDFAEVCDGASRACPGDVLLPAGIVCRAAADICDAPETCTGTDATCPKDELREAGTICRESVGPCDRADTCDGDSPSCPNTFQPAGFVCKASMTGACDAPDVCSGSTADCPPAYASDVVCRAAQGACDVPESCSGSSPSCPPDAVLAAGALCKDGAITSVCDGLNPRCP